MARADGGQLWVMTNAQVVCADGVDRVEAVVVRHAPTGRLSAVNASALVSFDARRSRDAAQQTRDPSCPSAGG